MNLDNENEENKKAVSHLSMKIDYRLRNCNPSTLAQIDKTISIVGDAVYCARCSTEKAFLNPLSGNHICLHCERVF